MYLDQLTSPEIENLSKNIPVIIPIAATEQHGPHLPLATDRMIGAYFLDQLNQEISSKLLIVPPISVGCSVHHMDFLGTLSLTHDTFTAVVEDLVQSLLEHGFDRIILFNSHGGNKGIAQVLLESLGPELDKMVLVTWWELAPQALAELSESGIGGVGHAGEFETSLMLHIAPDLVNQDLIIKGANQPTYPWAEADMLRSSQAKLYRSMFEMTPNGVFGDPTKASADKGQKISRLVVARLREIVLGISKD